MLLLLAQTAEVAAEAAPTPETLNTAGWVFMIGSMGVVISLFGYCLSKVLGGEDNTEHMHAPLDIDTQDHGT